MIAELLERDYPVVAIVVGSDESVITCKNTLNTLKSLEAIAKQKGKPVVMYYDHNVQGFKRSDIDSSLISAISTLAILGSRQNEEMDTRDISNWLSYHRVSDVKPQLSLLTIYESNDKVSTIGNPVSVASLYASPEQPTADIVPDYHCAGYTTGIAEEIRNLHFVISVDQVHVIAKDIQGVLSGLEEIRQSRLDNVSLVSSDDEISANGLVL